MQWLNSASVTGFFGLLGDAGTFLAAVGTLVLVLFTRRQLKALTKQVRQGQAGVSAAEESAQAARDAVRESARARIDDAAPRVVALFEVPQWPPFVNPNRAGNIPLLDSLSQSRVAEASEEFVFPSQLSHIMWFRTRGVIINEGHATARIHLGTEARFIEGDTMLLGETRAEKPSLVGPWKQAQCILRPGQVAMFEWGAGKRLDDFADAWKNFDPPNDRGTCFWQITVTSLDHSIVDKIYIELRSRPIRPARQREGGWLLSSVDNVHVVVHETQRMYSIEGTEIPPAPWHDFYRQGKSRNTTSTG